LGRPRVGSFAPLVAKASPESRYGEQTSSNSSLLHSEHLLQRGSLSRLTLLRATTDLILGSDFDFICLDY